IVARLPPSRDLSGSTTGRVEGDQIEAVRLLLEPLIPHDNDSTFRLLLPRYLLIPPILRGLAIAAEGPVTRRLTSRDGSSPAIEVQPIPMATYNAWAGPY